MAGKSPNIEDTPEHEANHEANAPVALNNPPARAPAGREVSVPAVVRAVAMLRLLSSSPIPLGVNQIARDLDIIPSTCLHILRALANEGLVAFDTTTKRYSLGLEILRLAKTALRDSIADQAQPYLDAIVRKFLVTAFAVSMSEPEHYVVTAKSNSPNTIRLHVDLGSRFPALVSATGRCVAAYSNVSPRVLKARFDKLRWHRAPDYEEWLAQVAAVREQGFSVDDGNYISGVYIVAAPILGTTGEFRHAIVALCIKEGWSAEALAALAETIRTTAEQVAEGLRLSVQVTGKGTNGGIRAV